MSKFISLEELKQAVAIKEQIAALEAELALVLAGAGHIPSGLKDPSPSLRAKRGGPRKMSAAGRARIIAAQKARWAKFRKEQKSK